MKNEEIISSIKNQAIAPGLSLVCWANEYPALLNSIVIWREKLEKEFEGKIIWYGNEHLHITLYSLIRTIYSRIRPIDRQDIQINIGEFVSDLSKVQPFEISLNKMIIKGNGEIQLAGGTKSQKDLDRYNAIHNIVKKYDPQYKYFSVSDKLKFKNLHCNFGYFATDKFEEIKEKELELDSEIVFTVNIISIVHYMRRTLESRYISGNLHLNISNSKPCGITKNKIYQLLGME